MLEAFLGSPTLHHKNPSDEEGMFGLPPEDESPRKVNEWRDTFQFDLPNSGGLPDVPLVIEFPQTDLAVPAMYPSEHNGQRHSPPLPEPALQREVMLEQDIMQSSVPLTRDSNPISVSTQGDNTRPPTSRSGRKMSPSSSPFARGKTADRPSSIRSLKTSKPVLLKSQSLESALNTFKEERDDRNQSRRQALPPMPKAVKPALKKSLSIESALNKLGEDKEPRRQRQRDSPRQRSVSPSRPKETVEGQPTLTMKQTLVQSLNSRASFHFRAGDFKDALRVFKDALRVARSDYAECTSIKEEDDGVDDDDDDVLENKKKSESVVSQTMEEQSVIMLVKTLNSIAVVHWRLGELEKSNSALDDAADVLDSVESGRMSSSTNSRSTQSGKRPTLLRDRSIEDLLSQPSARPSSLSFQLVKCETRINRGIVQYLEQDFERAVATLQSSLAGQRSALGFKRSSHTLVAHTMEILASAYDRQGHVEESIKLHREVLKMKKASLGSDDLSVARTLLSLGHRHCELQDYGLALAAYVEALRVQRFVLDPKHADIGVTLHYIGRVQLAMGLYDDAKANLLEAMSVYAKANLDSDNDICVTVVHDMDRVKEKLQSAQ